MSADQQLSAAPTPQPPLDLGSLRVHWLDGGEFRVDGGSMFGPVPKRVWSRHYPCDDENLIRLACRPLLIETPQGWGLIDAGFGHHLDERQRRTYGVVRLGALEQSLTGIGITPEEVQWLAVTHLHLDHASGLVRQDSDGRLHPFFPRARHVVQELEVGEMASPHERERHAYEQASWQPLVESGLVEVVQGTSEVVPGVEVFLTGGHSKGHQGVRLSGGNGNVVLHMGDVISTTPQIRPLWVSALDDYPLDSIEAKRRWVGEAISGGWWMVFYHDIRYLAGQCDAEYQLVNPLEAAPS